MFLTPKGRVDGYMLGVSFPSRKFADMLTAARALKVSARVDNLVLLCFAHNPISGPVGNVVILALRTGAILTLVGLVLFIVRLSPQHSVKDKL
ncbi:MAG: hypothetical protein JOY96_10730 [Verrucomicrobia bacterium]|nr:hypothetical protein [Verrucomicrobiota bacterium]